MINEIVEPLLHYILVLEYEETTVAIYYGHTQKYIYLTKVAKYILTTIFLYNLIITSAHRVLNALLHPPFTTFFVW